MGVQFGSQEHEDAIAKVLAACKKAKKTSAIFCASPFCSRCTSTSSQRVFSSTRPHPSHPFDHSLTLPSGLTGEQAEKRFAQGFDMVSVTTDIDTLVDGFASALATATGKLKEGAASSGYAT